MKSIFTATSAIQTSLDFWVDLKQNISLHCLYVFFGYGFFWSFFNFFGCRLHTESICTVLRHFLIRAIKTFLNCLFLSTLKKKYINNLMRLRLSWLRSRYLSTTVTFRLFLFSVLEFCDSVSVKNNMSKTCLKCLTNGWKLHKKHENAFLWWNHMAIYNNYREWQKIYLLNFFSFLYDMTRETYYT